MAIPEGIITKLLKARALGKTTAAMVLVYGMYTLTKDIETGVVINPAAENILIFLLGGAMGFLWNSCDK